jgi:light-regulated signal transduction histidine kinase (bacteriophytochrome)
MSWLLLAAVGWRVRADGWALGLIWLGALAVALAAVWGHRALRRSAEAEARVRLRVAELEAKNRELEAFSYSLSHDLRSPLRHINGFAELLRKTAQGDLGEPGSRYLDTISSSAQRAVTLVDELLAFARRGQVALRLAEVDLRALVEAVRAELDPELGGREVRWEIRALPRVQGDPTLLRLVVENLLSNAVKYTRPRAPAQIEVGAREEAERWIFFVRDNGVGFEGTQAAGLFCAFKRLHSEAQFEGTGMGLANVRRIAERHGGDAWAEGQQGQGATFYVSLPRAQLPGGAA